MVIIEEVSGVLKEVLMIHLEVLCIVSGVSRSPGGYWSSMRVLDFIEGVQSSLEKVKLATREVLMPLEEVLVVLQKDLGIHKGIPTGSNISSEGSRGPGGLVAIERVVKVVEEVLGVLKEVLVFLQKVV